MLSDLLIVERKANEIISRCLGKVSKQLQYYMRREYTIRKLKKKDVKIKSHSH